MKHSTQKDYKTTKGVVYGSKVLNTGYEFDSEEATA